MNNEIIKLEKVRKSCNVASVIIKIISVIMVIAMIACLGGAVGCFAMRDTIDTYMGAHPEVANEITGNIELFGADIDFDITNHYGVQFAAACLVAAVAILFLIIAMKLLGDVFNSILNSESPFTNEVTKTMKRSFICLTVFLFLSTGVFTTLATGLAFWCIYNLFQYGIELQNQVDETI